MGTSKTVVKSLVKTDNSRRAIFERQFDEADIKKQLLQEQFLKRTKELAENNKVTNSNTEGDKRIKDIKNKKALKNNKNTNSDKKVKELSSKVQEQKQSIVSLKKVKQELNEELSDTKKELEKYKEMDSRKDAKILELLKEVELLNAKNLQISSKNRTMKRDISFLKNETKSQGRKIKYRDATIIKYMRRIDALMTGDLSEYCNNCPKLNDLQNQITDLNGEIKSISKKHSSEISQMLIRLRRNRDTSTEISKQITRTVKVNENEITGVLKRSGDFNMYFESSLGKRFNIVGATNGIPDGSPCAVEKVADGKVSIVKIFPTDTKSILSTTKKVLSLSKRKCKSSDNTCAGMHFSTPYKVLLIGSRNKDKYTSALKQAGLNVGWFDSFEANVVRLRGMLDRYDIVICCYDHSKHYATNLMDYMSKKYNNPVKYNTVMYETVQTLLSRVNYVAENLNSKTKEI